MMREKHLVSIKSAAYIKVVFIHCISINIFDIVNTNIMLGLIFINILQDESRVINMKLKICIKNYYLKRLFIITITGLSATSAYICKSAVLFNIFEIFKFVKINKFFKNYWWIKRIYGIVIVKCCEIVNLARFCFIYK